MMGVLMGWLILFEMLREAIESLLLCVATLGVVL